LVGHEEGKEREKRKKYITIGSKNIAINLLYYYFFLCTLRCWLLGE
jgi:hypothetical protein